LRDTFSNLEMTTWDQRIAIATACGWKISLSDLGLGLDIYRGETVDTATERRPLPDYLNDLNAMHEAEKILNDKQLSEYWLELNHLLPTWSPDEEHIRQAWVFGSPAAQRAEAFLRTIGK
jgi:hypothetical protein